VQSRKVVLVSVAEGGSALASSTFFAVEGVCTWVKLSVEWGEEEKCLF
jgi:hypothetical protein